MGWNKYIVKFPLFITLCLCVYKSNKLACHLSWHWISFLIQSALWRIYSHSFLNMNAKFCQCKHVAPNRDAWRKWINVPTSSCEYQGFVELDWGCFFFFLSGLSVVDVNDEFFTGWCLSGKTGVPCQKLMCFLIFFKYLNLPKKKSSLSEFFSYDLFALCWRLKLLKWHVLDRLFFQLTWKAEVCSFYFENAMIWMKNMDLLNLLVSEVEGSFSWCLEWNESWRFGRTSSSRSLQD